MKKKFLTAFLTTVITTFNLFNSGFSECCDLSTDSCTLSDKFTVSVHSLIVQPCQNITWLTTTPNDKDLPTRVSYAFKYNWDIGIAVGASAQICDCWGLGFRYSHIQADTGTTTVVYTGFTDTNETFFLQTFHYLTPTSLSNNGATTTSWIKGKLEHKMHTFDIVAEYECCLCQSLSFKPFAGIKILSMKNNTDLYILDDNFTSANDGQFHSLDLKGYGVVAGFDFGWDLTNNFSSTNLYLIGSLSGTAMAGSSDNQYRDISAGGITFEPVFKSREPMLGIDTQIGLVWNPCLCGARFQFETSYIFKFLTGVANPAPMLPSNNENYSVQGFKLGLGVHF